MRGGSTAPGERPPRRRRTVRALAALVAASVGCRAILGIEPPGDDSVANPDGAMSDADPTARDGARDGGALDADRAWRESALKDITNGANHFGNADDVRKGTFKGMTPTVILGTGKDATYFFKA